MAYQFLSHTGDVKFVASGETFEEMLVSAAGALNETIKGDIKVLERKEKRFEVEGEDIKALLYNFLEEFLFLLDAENFLVSKIIEIKFDDKKMELKVKVVGDEASEYDFTNEVKAITFNEMYVKNEGNKFECQVVLDV